MVYVAAVPVFEGKHVVVAAPWSYPEDLVSVTVADGEEEAETHRQDYGVASSHSQFRQLPFCELKKACCAAQAHIRVLPVAPFAYHSQEQERGQSADRLHAR